MRETLCSKKMQNVSTQVYFDINAFDWEQSDLCIFNPSLTRPLDEVRQAFLDDMQFLEGQRWCGAAVKLFFKNQKCFVESEQKNMEDIVRRGIALQLCLG